jgi:hypothetical protein
MLLQQQLGSGVGLPASRARFSSELGRESTRLRLQLVPEMFLHELDQSGRNQRPNPSGGAEQYWMTREPRQQAQAHV